MPQRVRGIRTTPYGGEPSGLRRLGVTSLVRTFEANHRGFHLVGHLPQGRCSLLIGGTGGELPATIGPCTQLLGKLAVRHMLILESKDGADTLYAA